MSGTGLLLYKPVQKWNEDTTIFIWPGQAKADETLPNSCQMLCVFQAEMPGVTDQR